VYRPLTRDSYALPVETAATAALGSPYRLHAGLTFEVVRAAWPTVAAVTCIGG
jgi:hypothetical protein